MSVCIMPVLKAVKIYEVGMAWEQGKFCSVPGYDCLTMSNKEWRKLFTRQ